MHVYHLPLLFRNEITGDMEDIEVKAIITDIKHFDIIVGRDDCTQFDSISSKHVSMISDGTSHRMSPQSYHPQSSWVT
jgi:hypothetical protein